MDEQARTPRAPTPASALAARFRTDLITLSTGITVKARKVSLMREILGGSLPNAVLDWTIFGSGNRDVQEYALRTAEMHKARLCVVARILIEPKLVLGKVDIRDVTPNYEAGEIGPTDLTHDEVWELYRYGILEVVPTAEDAPFRAGADAGGSTGEPVPPVHEVSGQDTE